MENKIKIVFATGNGHKLAEINEISKDSGIEFVLPPDGFNPDETGATFEENSYIKAVEAAKLSGNIALADDSGLCVEALNGEPGIHSARYADTPQERISKLLKNLTPYGNRKAKFVCAMTLVDEFGNLLNKEIGECHGEIAKVQSGVNGFGYDPIFTVNGYNVTMADMSEDLKNSISHRSVALNKMITYIQQNLL
ncbi:RdgB/HAM1 family non-canonical purine NTP pyrophosphatase [bacterium]|nr:RdgB/HAM1 family non-canonical purine NTP pyrophosphatase [bacterium]